MATNPNKTTPKTTPLTQEQLVENIAAIARGETPLYFQQLPKAGGSKTQYTGGVRRVKPTSGERHREYGNLK